MSLKAAFIFLADGANSATDRQLVSTPSVDLTVVGAAVGTARIAKVVAGKAAVGVVRFDGHPGLDGKSGDAVFGDG